MPKVSIISFFLSHFCFSTLQFYLDFTGMSTLREWIQYRYGTFSETGFDSDPLYPRYYQFGPTEKASEGCPSLSSANLTPQSTNDSDEQMADASILRNKVRNWYLEIETVSHTFSSLANNPNFLKSKSLTFNVILFSERTLVIWDKSTDAVRSQLGP